ncbi:restriction endonuclease subunit S [Acinetobacter baumannii]|uniref:restriction endonuclease subunit S n=1 Tax=Acinetobacter baumannii TaxID=470 RepID=UPI0038927A44
MATPKLRFKEFDRKWDLKSLGDCFSLFSGYAFPSSASVDNGIRWLKIADVGIQEMTPNNLSFLPNDFKVQFPQFIVSKNDYVIALTRPILNKKLKIAKVGEFYDGALLNQRVAKIVSENNNLDFIYSLLQKSKTVEELENSIAGTDPPNLSLNEVKGIVLGIPKVEEQTKIASFLSAVDEKISQLTQKHELLSQYKQGMMQKLFSQQIRFKADDGSEFGEWGNKALNTLCSRSYQGINTVADKVEYQQSGYPILQAKHITSEKLDLVDVRYLSDLDYEKYKEKYIPNVNDILFSNIGTIGKVVLVDAENPFFIAWNIFLITPKETLITPLYLTSYLRWLTALNYFDNLQTGNATKFINKTDLLATVINLPCLEEQTKIANFLSAIDQKIEVVAQQIEQAKTWKKGLLQQMFV